jgi:Arc/MetJ family transcription regulator
MMRTTLEIDDDILQVARTLAAAERTSVGKMLSDLARSGLNSKAAQRTSPSLMSWPMHHGSRSMM